MRTAESRKYPRINAKNKVRIGSPMMNGGYVLGQVEQLSVGGCLFSTPISFESGRVLTFKIDIMDKEIVAVGEVVYRRMRDESSFMCGVRFEYLSPSDEAEVRSFIIQSMEDAA
jgi:c-di-GMP-binding flagellar brake protein YcgR